MNAATSRIGWVVLSTCVVALVPVLAAAWSPSPDVGVELGTGTFTSGDVLQDASAASPQAIDLGPLPRGADVVAFTLNDLGKVFFVLGNTLELPGGVVAGPQQVVAYEEGSYAIEFDVSPFVPDGVRIDAIGAFLGTTDVLISFDQPVDLSGLFVDDADVYGFVSESLVLDASAAGVPDGVDVDAIAEGASGDLLVSFDVGGIVDGVVFADEDVLRYALPAGVWTLEVDASTVDPAWERADADALHFAPEPGAAALFASGAVVLIAMRRSRQRPSSRSSAARSQAAVSAAAS